MCNLQTTQFFANPVIYLLRIFGKQKTDRKICYRSPSPAYEVS
jgi:hypothetical protein